MRDQVPFEAVKQLSLDRANAVKQELVNNYKFQPNQFSVEGMGWSKERQRAQSWPVRAYRPLDFVLDDVLIFLLDDRDQLAAPFLLILAGDQGVMPETRLQFIENHEGVDAADVLLLDDQLLVLVALEFRPEDDGFGLPRQRRCRWCSCRG
jgi:hypothetical protein